mgnify:CR=1 FL=1
MGRDLLARPQGRIPPGLVMRLWREMIGAFTMQEGRLEAAVTCGKGGGDLWDIARDYYGSLTPLLPCPSADRAIAAAAANRTQVAVVPLPAPRAARPWWRLFAKHSDLRVFARLPFDERDSARCNWRGNHTGGLAVARLDPEPTGDDHGLILIHNPKPAQAAQLRAAITRRLKPVAVETDRDQTYWLVTMRGLVNHRMEEISARLQFPGCRIYDCGGYAVPLGTTPRIKQRGSKKSSD